MAKQLVLFEEPPEITLADDYTSVIVSYSTGIDSAGVLYWALKNFPKEKIILMYLDTGLEHDENLTIMPNVAQHVGIKHIILRHPKGFMGILEERKKFPSSVMRWCTSYLKTGVSDAWIRANRHILGEKVLFLTGERRDESPRRAKMKELELHRTTLKTERKGKFTCHWHRPMLDYEKGQMFEWSKELGIPPHPCYEYLSRCSCYACVLMPDKHAMENMKRHPEMFRKLIQAEMKHGHSWKHKTSLKDLWDTVCEDLPLDMVV